MKNLHEIILPLPALPQGTHAVGEVEGPAIDTRGYEEAMVVFWPATATATGTIDVKVQHDDASDGDFADVVGKDKDLEFTQVDVDNDNTMYVGRINLRDHKRYIRLLATVGTDTVNGCAFVILGGAMDWPVTHLNPVAFTDAPTLGSPSTT